MFFLEDLVLPRRFWIFKFVGSVLELVICGPGGGGGGVGFCETLSGSSFFDL